MTPTGTILVVDDTSASLQRLVSLLTSAGYRVHPAESGPLALASAAADPPELILLDLRMPGMDGLEVFRRLQADPTTRAIPILFLAGETDDQLRWTGLRLGAGDFITKPFQEEELLARVRTHLELSRSRTRLAAQATELLQVNARLQANTAEHQRTEAALQESEARYRATLENMVDAVLLSTPDGTVLDANPAACQLFGRTEAEIRRVGRAGLVDTADPRLPSFLASRATTGRARAELTLLRGDGSRFEGECASSLFTDAIGRTCASIVIRDLTTQHIAAAKLEQAAQEWQATFDATRNAVWLLDGKSRIVRANRAAELLFGRSNAAMKGCPCWSIAHDTTAPIPDCPLVRAARSHQREAMELTIGDQWYEVIVDPILDAAGLFAGAVHSMSDITERKRASIALAESEARFSATFEQAAVGIAQVGLDGRWLRVNQRLCDIVGYSRDELLQRTFQDITHPDDLETDLGLVRRVLAGELETYALEKRYIRQDRSVVPINLTVSLVREASGAPLYFISVIEDITARQKSIQSLQESEARYRSLFELESDALFLIDNRTGEILEANRAATTLYGHTHDELVRLRNTDLSAEPDSTRQAMQDQAKQIAVRHHRRADGTVFPVEIVANHFTWEGRAVHLAGIRDITEHLRREEELRRASLRAQSLLRIAEPRQETDQEFLDRALTEALAITDSRFGYIYHYEEEKQRFILNTWSKDVMAACRVAEPRTAYDLDRTGIWGEAVRQRRPIILNDFAATHPLKKGYPEGHVALTRFLTIPVFEGERIVAVVGVANKPADYDEGDIVQLQLLMGSVWRALEHRRAELRIRDQYTLQRGLLEAFDTPVFSLDRDLRYTSFNRPHAEAMRALYGAETALGSNILDYQPPADRATAEHNLRQVLAGTPILVEAYSGTGATRRFFEINHTPIHDAADQVCGIAVLARDLTARRTMEETLRESEARFRAVVQNADAVIFLLDRDGRFELSEGRGLAGLGLQPGEVVGRSALALYADHPDIVDTLRRALEGRTAKRLVNLGSQVLDLFVTPRLGSDRAVTGVIGLANNVTARVRAEESLRESERFARSTIDALSAHLCVLDETGTILATNQAWRRFAETNPPEPGNVQPGANYLTICDAATGPEAADARAFAAGIRSVLSGEHPTFCLEYPCHSPTEQRWFIGRVTRFSGPGAMRVVVVHEAITERKRAEEALRAAHSNLEHLVAERTAALAASNALLDQTGHLARVGGWEINLLTSELTWTGATREIHEVDPEHRPSLSPAIAFYAPEAQPLIAEAVRNAITDGQPFDLELPFITARGNHLWVRATGQAYREQDQVVKIGGVFQDVTARRQSEDSLRQQRDQLERLLAELTAANQRLRELDRLKSEFLSTMSHELRTPLNSIIGFTGILLDEISGPLNPEQGKQLGLVQSSARHLLALINDLLDLSRIESGRIELHAELFDFSTVVAETVSFLAPIAQQKGLVLRSDCTPAALPLVGDRRRILQVLLNLVTNAVKFTARGEVVITVRLDTGRLVVAVRDTGIGIRPDQLPHLFEAFRQLDATAHRHYEGTGLGLHLCRKLLDLLGGAITVESAAGVGSTFTFTLPLAGAPAP